MITIDGLSIVNNELFVIAGPCVIEDRDITFFTAQRLSEICKKLGISFIFKSSYDKANRTSISSYRGPGIIEGLKILTEVKNNLQIPILTDVHTKEEIEIASNVVDCIQIPAFLCRQTDLIIKAAETNKPVNIKKGQFLAPWDIKNIIDKFISTGNKALMITERGTSFGYNNLVVDFRAFPIMRSYGYPVIFDVTHSLQLPGGKGTCSGGQREFAEPLMRAAVACGIDGLFMEVHPDPDKALCDGQNMIRLDDVERILSSVTKIHKLLQMGNRTSTVL